MPSFLINSSILLLDLFSFYFRKRYTGTCICSLCAVERPESFSKVADYQSISTDNTRTTGDNQEMAEMSIEKQEENGN